MQQSAKYCGTLFSADTSALSCRAGARPEVVQLRRLPAYHPCRCLQGMKPAADSPTERIACMDVYMEGVSSVKHG